MLKRTGLTLKLLFVLFVVVIISFYIPTPYHLLRPGSAEDLGRLIQVEGSDLSDEGKFFLVTVRTQTRVSLFWLIYGFFDPVIDVRHAEQIIPPELDEEDYRKILEGWMKESQMLATVIALNRAGYDIEIKGSGVVVHDFIEGSAAEGVLLKGDIIRAVDGEEVYLTEHANTLVQARKVGEKVHLQVERDGKLLEFDVKTVPNPEEPGTPALRIYIYALGWEPVLPLDITIDTGRIGGRSAGVMFVLEILDQLTDGDLSKGRLVAGTGTIRYDETIGRIGGVKQKVVTAEKEGAEYFLVPRDNYQEARSAARNIKVHSVDTLQDVLDFLHGNNTA